MDKFQVQEKNWFRGQGDDDSLLLRDDGKMCCLGFFALHCGYEPEEINGKLSPGHLCRNVKPDNSLNKLVDARGFNNNICKNLMIVNDDASIQDELRKENIKEYFKQINVEVEFV